MTTMGFALVGESFGQQPPAWSPQPYTKPAGTTSELPANSLPVNSLRGGSAGNIAAEATAATQDINNTSTTAVARWRKIEQAAEPRARSYSNTFSPAQEPAPQVQDTQSQVTQTSRQSAAQFQPRTSDNGQVAEQAAAPVVRRNAVVPARKVVAEQNAPVERFAEQAVEQAVEQQEASEIRLASATSVVPASSRNAGMRAAQSSSRRGSVVEAASYQETSEPPSLNLEPPQFGQQPSAPANNLDLQSPSDASRSNRGSSLPQRERAYQLPETQSNVDCEALRAAIQNADITKIRVDTSPAFVEGYRSNQELSSKEAFLQDSKSRVWYNLEGQEIARGRLVDMAYGAVVIETADGTKVNYLLNKLSEADRVYVSEAWGIPVTCNLNDGSFDSRDFVATSMTWKASGACHKPLYFEEVQLERYGHEWGPVVQPAISSLNFVKNVVFLPYKMGIHPMNECQYSLGYYRPGSCAPWTVGPVPISLRGAAAQAAVVGGAAWALP